MYITYETIAGNDPRRDPKIVDVGTFWHYTVSKIAPEDEASVRIDWLKGEVLSEPAALAHKLVSSVDGELTVLTTKFSNYGEIINPSSGGDPNNPSYVKEIYFLNEQDETYAMTYLKAVLKNYAKNHLVCDGIKNHVDTLAKINQEVENAQSLNQLQLVMKDYFKVDASAYTQNRPSTAKFIVNW